MKIINDHSVYVSKPTYIGVFNFNYPYTKKIVHATHAVSFNVKDTANKDSAIGQWIVKYKNED